MAYSPKIIAASDRINVQLVSNFHQSTTTADNLDGNDHGFSDDVSMSYVQENSENEHRGNFPKDMYKNQELLTWLYSWKLKHNISHDAMSELLNQLRICGHADLPKDARTLLGTPTFNPVEISATGGATYTTLSRNHSSKMIQLQKAQRDHETVTKAQNNFARTHALNLNCPNGRMPSLSGADVALQNRTPAPTFEPSSQQFEQMELSRATQQSTLDPDPTSIQHDIICLQETLLKQDNKFGTSSHIQFRKNIASKGDMNAHQNTFWYCNYTDKVGPILCNEIDRSNLIILNKDAPTLMQPPNLVLASPNLALIADPQTNSDSQGNHFPVCTTIGGNVNAHPTFWYCDYTNKVGQIICSENDRSDLVILNKDAPTLIQPPDLVLASPNLAPIADSQTDSNPQASDHFPVCITIEGKVIRSRQFHYKLKLKKEQLDDLSHELQISADEFLTQAPSAPAEKYEYSKDFLLKKARAFTNDKYYDDNIQSRNLDKSEQVVADKSEQVVANKSEQVVADKSEQVMADKSKQMITDKSEQVVADKSEQMVADKSEQMMTDKSEQMVVDNCNYDEDAQSSAWTDKIRLREHLISEIRKRPPLWNFKLPPEKRRIEKRERLWEEVSIKLNKEGSTKKLKKMWRSLCDSFRVHHYRKKMLPSKSTICSPWVHYESMKFISDVQLQSFTITNAADTKTLTTDRTVNDDNNSTDRCAKNRTTKNRRQRCTKRDYT
ncbi:hypothetical protein G5I_08437 [Acromyrmex echinatior]|uniref:MADF domain-containing protein n=1 Tax=Acromyrmex echinatior TaxID=103372 RepID=F4WRI3_ACREC|nr:hypothetical protein G5I_08437 [Acromyrmex echinatior]